MTELLKRKKIKEFITNMEARLGKSKFAKDIQIRIVEQAKQLQELDKAFGMHPEDI